MTLDELAEHWQEYAVAVDIEFKDAGKRIKKSVVLKERYFVCFRSKDSNGQEHLVLDPGGHNPLCLSLRCDSENNAYIRLSSAEWLKVGKFIKLK